MGEKMSSEVVSPDTGSTMVSYDEDFPLFELFLLSRDMKIGGISSSSSSSLGAGSLAFDFDLLEEDFFDFLLELLLLLLDFLEEELDFDDFFEDGEGGKSGMIDVGCGVPGSLVASCEGWSDGNSVGPDD